MKVKELIETLVRSDPELEVRTIQLASDEGYRFWRYTEKIILRLDENHGRTPILLIEPIHKVVGRFGSQRNDDEI